MRGVPEKNKSRGMGTRNELAENAGAIRIANQSVCNSLPGLKRTALPGGMFTSLPVRGLRPMPVLRGRTLKTPNLRSSIRWPRPRACLRDSKIVSTACSAFVRLMSVLATTAFTISSLITRASASRGQMLEGEAQVVKAGGVHYTVLLFDERNFQLGVRRSGCP